MCHSINLSNGKWQTVADLENDANEFEENLVNVDKSFLRKVLNSLSNLMNTVKHEETGIFSVVLKWFRLYLNVHVYINPNESKLLKYFESTVPRVITYIIGCLQYKTKDVPNYHYKLLEILEQLLENVPPNVLKKISSFEIGTIGCLWNPIDIVGDFNTQLKALKILSMFLKHFDNVRQNEELKYIKWTNLNLFQDKLKMIVRETQISHQLENTSRELLNNFNMNLSKTVLVYSFYCKTLELGNRYIFYKPLYLEKFWIDINYSPKTLSYNGRFKLNSKSKYENINVTVEVQKIKLENSILIVHFKEPGEFSKYSELFSNLSQNVVKFNLPVEEKLRLENHTYIMEYFNNLNDTHNNKVEDAFNLLKTKCLTDLQEVKNINFTQKRGPEIYHFNSPPEKKFKVNTVVNALNKSLRNITPDILDNSPKTSRKAENKPEKHPIRKLRDRKKFFTTLFEEDSEKETVNKKTQRRKPQYGKPRKRQTKSRSKKVCKVSPTIDLAKIENTKDIKQSKKQIKALASKVTNSLKDTVSKCSSPIISAEDCARVLKNVSDIYNTSDSTFAKPCQSYRKFKTELISNQSVNINNTAIVQNRKKKNFGVENDMLTPKKKRKVLSIYNEENKENINPNTENLNLTTFQPSQHNKSVVISPHLFESQHLEATSLIKILRTTNDMMNNSANKTIDLTLDEEIIVNNSLDYEEVRGNYESPINVTTLIGTPIKSTTNNFSKLCTPRPTSSMNISDLNDSDIELTQIPQNSKFIIEPKNNLNYNTANENEHRNNTNCELREENVESQNIIQQILQDFDCGSNDFNPKCISTIENINSNIVADNNIPKEDFQKDGTIFQKHLDTEESEDNSDNEYNKKNNCYNEFTSFSNLVKPTEKPIKRDFIVMHNKPIYTYQQNGIWSTPDKNDIISTNITTKTATKCHVTPTTVILHQVQVSTEKSILLKNSKPKNLSKEIKAKKSLSDFYPKKQMNKSKIDDLMLRYTNLDTIAVIPSKDGNNNDILISPKYTANRSNYHKICQNSENVSRLSLATKNQHIESTNLHHNINNNNGNILQDVTNLNLCNPPSINPASHMLYIEGIDEYSSDFPKDFENNETHNSTSVDEMFKNDLVEEIIINHNKTIQLLLENIQILLFSNISKMYAKNFGEFFQSIMQKSEKQRLKLEQLRSNIGQLVKEIEIQYDTFMKRTKEFDINREIVQHFLESFTNMDMQNIKTKDYDGLIKQLNEVHNELLQKLLHVYLEKRTTMRKP